MHLHIHFMFHQLSQFQTLSRDGAIFSKETLYNIKLTGSISSLINNRHGFGFGWDSSAISQSDSTKVKNHYPEYIWTTKQI